MTAGFGVVVGRLKRRFRVRIPIVSSCFSSEGVSVQDSQLYTRLGMTLFSYSIRRTLDSIFLIMSDEAVVLICLMVADTLFSLISKFLLFLLSLVMVSPRYL